MKRRCPAPAATQSEAAAVRTGEHCPQTGWWYPLQAEPAAPASAAAGLTQRYVGQGSVMPAIGGSPSLWLPSRNGWPRSPHPYTRAREAVTLCQTICSV
ncbi:hypothetical protein QF036_000422 [Arthrobacter globiformis]|nr:hypothetical protein [Arthrobacter globiformis]